jgi:hypothetical protein
MPKHSIHFPAAFAANFMMKEGPCVRAACHPENRFGAQAPWCPFLNFL